MDATRLWPLEGVVQRYAWGSPTAIPELLGHSADGEPQAELWLGAHPKAPARVTEGGVSLGLDAWIAQQPEALLGAEVARRFEGRLPFLFKVLAAGEPLSIQAHPDAEQARAGYAREEAEGVPRDAPHRLYRDAQAKPEMLCALTPFRVLCGFRTPEEIDARLASLAVPALSRLAAGLRDQPASEALYGFFSAWMNTEAGARNATLRGVLDALPGPGQDAAADEVRSLARGYPDDPGVLAPFFLNVLELAPGEAIYLDAREMHSYLRGTGIEIMGNSDNVLRGGLTPKHVDVPELLRTLRFEARVPERLGPPAGAAFAYPAPVEEFLLTRLALRGGDVWSSPDRRSLDILLCVAGEARLREAEGRERRLSRGGAIVAPAAAGSYRVEGDAELFRASVPTEG